MSVTSPQSTNERPWQPEVSAALQPAFSGGRTLGGMTTHLKKNPPAEPLRVIGLALLAVLLTAVAAPLAPASADPPAPARLTAAKGSADAKFGTGVSISGDTAVAGAPDEGGTAEDGGMGAAYVFTRSNGAWTERATLLSPFRTDGEKFGFSVAVDRDTVVVGAPSADELPPGRPGAAYVFVRRGTTWVHQATLKPAESNAADGFGFDVALSRDTAVVGSLSGAAYVFTRSGNGWSQQAKLTGRGDATGDGFGGSVAISDDTAVVSALDDDVAPGIDQGSAYVFTRTGSKWTEQARLVAADGLPKDAFGDSVTVLRDTVVVGASLDDVGLNPKQGSAYVFVRNGASWAQHAKLTAPAPHGDAGDMFGRSVATNGDSVVVSAHFDEDGGSAYVFNRVADAWSEPTRLTAAGAGLFGVCIGLSGDTLVAGANFTAVDGKAAQGAAYVFGL